MLHFSHRHNCVITGNFAAWSGRELSWSLSHTFHLAPTPHPLVVAPLEAVHGRQVNLVSVDLVLLRDGQLTSM